MGTQKRSLIPVPPKHIPPDDKVFMDDLCCDMECMVDEKLEDAVIDGGFA